MRAVIGRSLEDDVMSMGAATAFYTALSFAPLLILLTTVGSVLGDSAQIKLVQFFETEVGRSAGNVAADVLQNAERHDEPGGILGKLGLGLLVVTASAVFAQLQASFNRIWETKVKPKAGLWAWIRKRLLSMGMVLTILFILLVALVLSAVIERVVPPGEELVGRVVFFVVSLAVSTVLFAAMFKVLPDAHVGWRQIWTGALITACLFAAGKTVLGIYLEHANVGKSYGESAGALIALLVWVYYSSIILFVGAEMARELDADSKPASIPT